ncbi:hypothetical protein Zmor_011289 [Zophobas morio]|uniref:Endonuclease/exonuclease/phosphatase domain-containing protein n=1 Tax=Zophobas morio TaxID=2755281 RepID=A0AA38IKI0_9CUCU|nr:hypothetical protein Zmor_011289 [Zophobas morio]
MMQHNIDIAIVTEHWFSTNKMTALKFSGYKVSSHFCRCRYIHGGVLILIKDNLRATEITQITEISEEKNAELTAIRIDSNKSVILAAYRSPSGNLNVFLEALNDALDIISELYSYDNIYVAGDFNVDFLKDSSEKRALAELLETFGLQPQFSEPSRVTKTTATCNDNIFGKENKDYTCTTLNWFMSDHQQQLMVVEFENNIQAPKSKKQRIKVRNIRKENIYRFKSYLSELDWSHLLCQKHPPEAYAAFHSLWMSLFDI